MAQNSPATTKKSRKSKKVDAPIAVNMIESTGNADSGDAALDALMASLETPAGASDEVIEKSIVEPHTDAEIEAAVAGAESVEAMILAATPEGVVEAGAIPTGEGSDVTPADTAAASTAEKTVKVRTPRKHYSDKVERLKDRVGTDLASYTVLTAADAGVTDEDVVKAMNDTLDIIRKMNKKEQTRAGFLIEFMAGKKAKLNEVLHRALDVLKTEGFISTGKDGNVFTNLLARPYSPAAARAMGGNTVAMFADLKLIVPDGKQRYVANPESLVLAKVRAMLDAVPAASETPAAA